MGFDPICPSLRNTSPRCALSADDGTPDLRESTSSRDSATTGISGSLGQTLYRAQAYAYARKASRPIDNDDPAQFSESDPS